MVMKTLGQVRFSIPQSYFTTSSGFYRFLGQSYDIYSCCSPPDYLEFKLVFSSPLFSLVSVNVGRIGQGEFEKSRHHS
jgi:hypothetical protein